jgi:hypothetical protein
VCHACPLPGIHIPATKQENAAVFAKVHEASDATTAFLLDLLFFIKKVFGTKKWPL